MIALPILLMGLVIGGFGLFQMHSFETDYGVKPSADKWFFNSVQLMNNLTEDSFKELKNIVQENPSELEDLNYLNDLNQKYEEKYSYLIVRKNDQIIYIGSDEDISAITERLPEPGEIDSLSKGGLYFGGDLEVLIKCVTFEYDDGSPGDVFFVTNTKGLQPQMKEFCRNIAIAIVMILILTAAILVMWIYRGISVPLRKMQMATAAIREGNLDYELVPETDDEMGRLYRDFDEMRKRLKANAEEKVNVDTGNKELISNISHDLKTPLTTIKGYVEGIMDGVADTPEKMDRYIHTIYNKTNEMTTLINELTFYSKIDTNRIPYNFNTISVTGYFNDCAEELSIDLEEKGLGFSYSNYVEDGVKIIADPEQLRRVINNIVGNAVKYMNRKDGRVLIRVKDVGDFVQVEIEDNGPGIAASDLPYIFERFYRADASRNSSRGGSGIGLSIVKKIIEEHGGKIWANSREGTGTVMYFVIRKYQEVPVNE
jgi:signal transduction histidine kinase